MKKSNIVTLELTSKEAIELLSSQSCGKGLTAKIIKALREQQPYPKGAVASAVNRATSGKTTAAKKARPSKTTKATNEAMESTATQ